MNIHVSYSWDNRLSNTQKFSIFKVQGYQFFLSKSLTNIQNRHLRFSYKYIFRKVLMFKRYTKHERRDFFLSFIQNTKKHQ